MEEKITQNAAGVSIIVYAGTQQSAEAFAASMQQSGDMTIKTYDFSSGLSKKNKFAENKIAFVIAEESNSYCNDIIRLLDKNGANYILVPVGQNANALLDELAEVLSFGLTPGDFAHIKRKGITTSKINQQLDIFKNGIAKISLKKPATIGDGIFKLPKKAAEEYAAYFDEKKDLYKLLKFVPASGAASRMFKFLNEFLAGFNPEEDTLNSYVNRKKDNALNVFLVGIEKFPFFKAIQDTIRQHPDYNEWSKSIRAYHFIKTMLLDEKFDFANKPKGILPFHTYPDIISTPVCEQLKESIAYAASNNNANIHFTISEEHLDGFLDAVNEGKEYLEQQSDTKLSFSFSNQHQSTDTLAVSLDNKPFRENGVVLFRPGGHGALIENLNELEADIVFIKNIDNVSHNGVDQIALYKKALAGGMIELQEQIFIYLERIDEGGITEEEINEIFTFAKEQLSQHIPADVHKFTTENKVAYAREMLNRPIRVCGMVKNEGEPGGGPFWVEEEKGRLSLQIVESSQVDMDNQNQKQILSQSTHFNPVDLVCGLTDYKGNKFDLRQYVDGNTGFIVQKNRLGKEVKSYELPGLWNGAMAGWITVFVEVPLETFNPVKTVNDLLKPAHQPQ